MKILGLDISTNTGWCLANTAYPISEWTKGTFQVQPKEDRFLRYEAYASMLRGILKDNEPDVAFIEGYGYMNNHTLATLVEIGTVLRLVVRRIVPNKLTPIYEVPPTSLKKFVCGRGDTQKNQMLLETYKRWHTECKDDNEADAVGLAAFGMYAMFDYPEVLTKPREEVLDKYRKLHKISPVPWTGSAINVTVDKAG